MTIEKRPWGHFEILDSMPLEQDHELSWKVKRIVVKPNEALSLQSHQNRDEYWVIVSGSGYFQKSLDSTDIFNVSTDLECRYINIPAGMLHRIVAGDKGIEFIEVAVSKDKTVDELDIVRYKDNYGRA